MALKERVEAVVNWVMALKPTRVFNWFIEHRGPLLSAGLSYSAMFAVFAALWVGFAIAGSFIASNPMLQEALFAFIDNAVPGLIDDGSGNGAVSPEVLLNTGAITLTGIIAAGVLIFTAFGWLGAGRDAVRHMFNLPGQDRNVFLLWAKDLGLAVAFGAAVLLSAVISVLSSWALGNFFDWIGLDERSSTAYWVGRVVGVLLVFVLDAVILGVFYRVVSGIPIPFTLLAGGTLLAAGALGVLKILGQVLLGGGTNNPLLASFAVIIGLLIWFNLVCQVILIGSAWIAVGAADRGLTLTGAKKKKVSAAG